MLDSEITRAINTSLGSSSSLRCNRQNSNHVPLVVTYHPNLPKLEWTIRLYHHIQYYRTQIGYMYNRHFHLCPPLPSVWNLALIKACAPKRLQFICRTLPSNRPQPLILPLSFLSSERCGIVVAPPLLLHCESIIKYWMHVQAKK